jgi:hypothetical protein
VLKTGFKGGPGLQAQQYLRADDEQAALVEPVLDFMREGRYGP